MDCNGCTDTIQARGCSAVKICTDCADRIGPERLALVEGLAQSGIWGAENDKDALGW